jgi:hypothetical protein
MRKYTVNRSSAEIDEQLNRAAWAEDNGTKVPEADYETGVKDALQWVLGLLKCDEPLGPEYDE